MQLARPYILVIDDDQAILETVTNILADEGYEYATATNGAEALATLAMRSPQLILLDMRMPVMDGWAFARALGEQARRVPILVMTAARDGRQWADEIGAADFVTKPFDLVDLLDAIERQLKPC